MTPKTPALVAAFLLAVGSPALAQGFAVKGDNDSGPHKGGGASEVAPGDTKKDAGLQGAKALSPGDHQQDKDLGNASGVSPGNMSNDPPGKPEAPNH